MKEDHITFIAEDGESITITCCHNKKIVIDVCANDGYWDNGGHIETTGCVKCAEKANMRKPYGL